MIRDRDRLIDACCRQLIADGVIEPLALDDLETRDWNAWELASLIEGHLHEVQDVARLTDEERRAYERRVTYHGGPLSNPHEGYSLPFWLLEDGRRAGTIAIATLLSGIDLISVSSLYVEPASRRPPLRRKAPARECEKMVKAPPVPRGTRAALASAEVDDTSGTTPAAGKAARNPSPVGETTGKLSDTATALAGTRAPRLARSRGRHQRVSRETGQLGGASSAT